MNYSEDDLLAFIERHDEHETYYREQLRQLQEDGIAKSPPELDGRTDEQIVAEVLAASDGEPRVGRYERTVAGAVIAGLQAAGRLQAKMSEGNAERAAQALFEDPLSPAEYTWAEMVAEDPERAEMWRADARRILDAAGVAPQVRAVEWSDIAAQVRRHCTIILPDGSVPSDAAIHAVADWIEQPPDWVQGVAPQAASEDSDRPWGVDYELPSSVWRQTVLAGGSAADDEELERMRGVAVGQAAYWMASQRKTIDRWRARAVKAEAAIVSGVAPQAGEHDCASCKECLHDGGKCCGCYDDACCKESAVLAPVQPSSTVNDRLTVRLAEMLYDDQTGTQGKFATSGWRDAWVRRVRIVVDAWRGENGG